MKFGYRTPSIKKRIAARTSVKRAIRSKARVPRGYGFITNPKKAAYNRVYNRTTSKACYIATAVYGNQDAWQVVRLRSFRDTVLRKTFLGRVFIFTYYAISPHLVYLFKNVSIINKWTKRMLDMFIENLE